MHPTGWFKYVVLDKNYFPNPSAIRSAASLSPADGARIKFSTTDQIFELHCCFVIVKSQPFRLAIP